MESQKEFRGLWIPKEIWFLDKLSWTEKLILVEIDNLEQQKECYANNQHFSKLFGVTKESVSRIINKLVNLKYLISEIKYKSNTKQVERRILNVNWNFLLNQNDNTSPQISALPPHKQHVDLPPQTLKKDTQYRIPIRNNIYAQNRPQSEQNLQTSETLTERFERFYKIYPKKKNKGKALNWFKIHKPSDKLVDLMIESIEQQKLTLDFQKENGRYIPYPATWLNSRGWENEISPQEIVDFSENSVSRLLAIELYKAIKNVQFTLTTDTEKLIKSWCLEIEKYLSYERTREREDRIFYAISTIKNSDKWTKIVVDAKSLIKNIDFIGR